jgi:hypothetical protein
MAHFQLVINAVHQMITMPEIRLPFQLSTTILFRAFDVPTAPVSNFSA